jgi:hypothetical protein
LKRLSFDVEVLTPAFVGDLDPRKLDKHAQLRPHTIRALVPGAMKGSRGAQIRPLDSFASPRGDRSKGKLEPTGWDEMREEKEVAG